MSQRYTPTGRPMSPFTTTATPSPENDPTRVKHSNNILCLSELCTPNFHLENTNCLQMSNVAYSSNLVTTNDA